MPHKIKLVFFLIIVLAAFLRIYKIDQIPPSISWDEAAVGYNAYTIANWGKDEWGKTYPLYFKSFEENKYPVHIYLTALSVKIFGLSDFSTRLPAAIFGVLNVVIIFFLAKIIFQKDLVALLAMFFLAVSPYNLQFSRFSHEANFSLFFFMAGSLMFYQGLRKNRILFSLSFLSFGISLITYQSPKIVVPPIILLLMLLYFKDVMKIKKYFFIGLTLLSLILIIIWFNPALLGIARLKQTAIPSEVIKNTALFKNTNNELLGRVEVAWNRYLAHLNTQYLFISGDRNTKFSTQAVGAFYRIDALFLVVGLCGILLRKKRSSLVLLSWAALAVIPPSIFGGEGEVPHAARALFVMGSWHLIAAYGFSKLINIFNKPALKILILVSGLTVLGFMFKDYIYDYYNNYPTRDPMNWQYGMKQSVEYLKDHNGYFQVYTTDVRFQPYIFFLYYLQTPLPKFRETVIYNTDIEKRKYNLVSVFDKYHFGDWDPIESMINPGVLYVVTASQYGGLRHRDIFDIKQRVQLPGGGDAFYLVSYP